LLLHAGSLLALSLALKMVANYFSETPADFH
jgi:hypothetical protein